MLDSNARTVWVCNYRSACDCPVACAKFSANDYVRETSHGQTHSYDLAIISTFKQRHALRPDVLETRRQPRVLLVAVKSPMLRWTFRSWAFKCPNRFIFQFGPAPVQDHRGIARHRRKPDAPAGASRGSLTDRLLDGMRS